ncbi:von Willebrand factor A domain-containing protein 3A [Ambystoma mexicanum]|uniref:von Willebrand factor A domain-containing protein 3A n=1 Tax=Ambystoma mexicanum TaxID=8296 RepID=UPI0037E76743
MNAPTTKMAQILDNEHFLKSSRVDYRPNPGAATGQLCWSNVKSLDMEADNSILATHVNQTRDLLCVQGREAYAIQTSEEWLTNHSLEHMKLTIEDLVRDGNIVMGRNSISSKHIEFTADTVNNFESRVHKAMELYHQRIDWLLEDSRKMFGLVKGSKIGILVDSSDLACGPGLLDFQKGLLCLVDEQLCHKKQLFFIAFGTDSSCLWQTARDVNVRILHESRQWIQQLKPSGGCNMLAALKKLLLIKDLDSLVIIARNCPDQAPHVLSDYFEQCILGRKLQIHTVAYECASPGAQATLRVLAECVEGRYHCYSSDNEEQIYTSSDVQMLFCEYQRFRDVLSKIKDMRQGMMGDALISIMQEISTEVAKMPPNKFLPRPVNHEGPLVIETPGFLPKTSVEWLKKNGLKGKKLSLYQVLAPNAYSPVEEFIPILQKTVSSTLHERAMLQFEWHDGTVKNLHVDLPILYEYQKQLAKTVKTYERRIEWLSGGSRRIWGSVCERRVVVLVDISVTNAMYIIHIQHSLRILLEEQMANKDFFNIIALGSQIVSWKPEVVPPTPENLQSAWKWVLSLQCEGGRNLMGALRRAVEVNFIEKDTAESQGLYLFTSGIPDQELDVVTAYIAEACGGCDLQLHVCLFTINAVDYDDTIPAQYTSTKDTSGILREIAHAANGRFHWFEETGIIDSDDISSIMSEMEKAVNYSKKCAFLVESLKQRCGSQTDYQPALEDAAMNLVHKEKNRRQKIPPPKPTALSLARMNFMEDSEGEKPLPMKALMWRPNSTKAVIPQAQPIKECVHNDKEKSVKQKKESKTSLSVFYTEEGKNVGVVYKKFPKTKTIRKSVPLVVLPKEEQICSTKEWLKKYGLKKLKLEISNLMFGPDCTHQKQMVQSLHKKVSAKYCSIFPSVEISGVVKHLQFQPKELEEYIDQVEKVLRRYIQRMQWLLSGSRRMFGTILENNVCILLDSSGHMAPFLPEIKKELTSLIWEQLRNTNARFNLISFAEYADVWQDCLVEATDEACHDAVQWVSKIKSHGSTSIFEAIQKAFQFCGVQGLYLLTDGNPHSNCNRVLTEVGKLLKEKDIILHAICFSCSNRSTNAFLKNLANQTGGRYHRCHGDVDGHLVAHRMLTEGFKDEDDPVLPLFEGDDLKKLASEIGKARQCLTQAHSFQLLLLKRQMELDPKDISFHESNQSDRANLVPGWK